MNGNTFMNRKIKVREQSELMKKVRQHMRKEEQGGNE
jgi:hypothetical protein